MSGKVLHGGLTRTADGRLFPQRCRIGGIFVADGKKATRITAKRQQPCKGDDCVSCRTPTRTFIVGGGSAAPCAFAQMSSVRSNATAPVHMRASISVTRPSGK